MSNQDSDIGTDSDIADWSVRVSYRTTSVFGSTSKQNAIGGDLWERVSAVRRFIRRKGKGKGKGDHGSKGKTKEVRASGAGKGRKRKPA